MSNLPTLSPQPQKKVYAPVVRRRSHTFPSRIAGYFDCTKWGGGYYRVANQPRGATVLNKKGECLDLQTGEVYLDARFVEETA
jgi:hypothetical protein